MADFSEPEFLKQANVIVRKWDGKCFQEIQDEMKLSNVLAEKACNQFKNFRNLKKYSSQELQINNTYRPAIIAYTGTVFKGIEWYQFSQEQFRYAQNSLLIISGLYGVLRPLDMIQPYRLEMKFEYTFWRKKLTEYLKEGNSPIINLASSESTSALSIKELEGDFYTIDFKEKKGATYKVVAVYAKKARGMLANWMIQNQIDNINKLQEFNVEGYTYNKKLSSKYNLVFTR